MQKTIRSFLLILMLCFLSLPSIAEDTETWLYIEKTSVQVTVGGYGWLKTGMRNLKPGVKMTSLSWESTDESVVRIGDDAKYVAVGRGRAQIIRRVTTNDGQEYTAVCDVQVVIPVDHLESSVTNIVLVAGRETELPEVRVLPEDADVRTCSWSVSSPETVRVEDGKLKALSAGKAVLTATCDERIDKHRLRTLDFPVTVIPAVESLEIGPYDGVCRLEEGRREALSLRLLPLGTPMEVLQFSSSAEEILTISPDGVMLGHAPGKTVVTVWTDQTVSGERMEAALTVEVYRKIDRISLRPNPYVSFRGQKVNLTPVISPQDADLSSLTVSWHSDNPYVAEVYGEDLTAGVICSQVGQSTITVQALDGSRKRATLHFRVEPAVPAAIREANVEKKAGGLEIALQIKSRMRETTLRGLEMVWTAMDGNGNALAARDYPLSVNIPAARRGFYALRIPEGDLPEGTVQLVLRITGISYPNGSYAIPAAMQESVQIPLK